MACPLHINKGDGLKRELGMQWGRASRVWNLNFVEERRNSGRRRQGGRREVREKKKKVREKSCFKKDLSILFLFM